MSWEQYVKDFDKGPGAVYSGLFGFDGNPWATSSGFSPAQKEVAQLIRLVKGEELGPDERIVFNGRQYTLYKLDDGKLCVLSKDSDEKVACLVCLLTTGVIVSVVKVPQLQPACNYIDFYHNYLKQY